MMRRYTATTKGGETIRLYSDDTLTMAIGSPNGESYETTARDLAEVVSFPSLLNLYRREPSEKLAKALRIALEAEIEIGRYR